LNKNGEPTTRAATAIAAAKPPGRVSGNTNERVWVKTKATTNQNA